MSQAFRVGFIGLVLAITAVAAACSPFASAVLPGPLLTVETRGGHCLEGMCESRTVIVRDGRVHRT